MFEDRIFQPILDKFKELIGESKDKKNLTDDLIKIFPILWSTKTPTLTKIIKGDKNKRKNYAGTMARTKAKVRRLSRSTFVAAPGQRIGNKNKMNRTPSMFKIKTLLPQIKQVEVKKNGQIEE